MRSSFVLLAVASCAPSQAYLFDPVDHTVRERTGITPEWRAGRPPSAAAAGRVRALLAEPLTADAAAVVAVLRSPRLQAAYEELGLAGAAVATARALPNPQVDVAVRFPIDRGDTQVELTVTESLTGLVGAILRGDAAGADVGAARRRAAARTVELATAAKIAAYRAAAAERLAALRKGVADAAAASAELARALARAGNVTKLELTRELLAEEDAAVAAQDADAEAIAARAALRAVLASPADEGLPAVAPLADPPAAAPDTTTLEDDAVAASLDLDALRLDGDAAGARADIATYESVLPDVGAGVSAKREGDWGVGPAVRVTLPLFDWGAGKRAAADAAVRRVADERADVALAVRAAARAARARLAAAHARALRLRDVVLPLRNALREESMRQYNAMALSAFELLALERERILAEERAVAAARDYFIARAEVDELRAGALPRGVAADETKGDRP
jgi:cobalt-zinc-cadmium efflux system outer membrane protein